MATGHQRSDGRARQKPYLEARSKKMAEQLPEQSSAPEANVLRGVRVYIDGYLANSTDIEMKRIVTLAGGEAMSVKRRLASPIRADGHNRYTASGATHILTSQQLSGSKNHKILVGKSKNIVHVVRPEWVTDSIAAGKRLPERTYSALPTGRAQTITDAFGTGSSRNSPIELD